MALMQRAKYGAKNFDKGITAPTEDFPSTTTRTQNFLGATAGSEGELTHRFKELVISPERRQIQDGIERRLNLDPLLGSLIVSSKGSISSAPQIRFASDEKSQGATPVATSSVQSSEESKSSQASNTGKEINPNPTIMESSGGGGDKDPPKDDKKVDNPDYPNGEERYKEDRQWEALRSWEYPTSRGIPSPREEKRTPLPARYTWNGDLATFDEFQEQVEGHYGQVGAGYLFMEDFQERYMLNGISCWIDFKSFVSSEQQAKRDICALYGALRSACKNGIGKSMLVPFKKEQDGIKAWRSLVKKYEGEGNTEVRIEKLEHIISVPYTRSYKGGLLQFIQDYENAFAELDILGNKSWLEDNERKRRILSNVTYLNEFNNTMYREIAKGKTFPQVCDLLRQQAVSEDHHASLRATRKARLTQSSTGSEMYEAIAQQLVQAMKASTLSEDGGDQGSQSTDMEALSCKLSSIDDEVWKKLPSDVRKLVMDQRTADRGDQKKPYESGFKKDDTKKSTLPSQYSKSNKGGKKEDADTVNMLAFIAKALEGIEGNEEDEGSESSSSAHGNMTSVEYVEISEEDSEDISEGRCMNSLYTPSEDHFAIFDSGSDSSIIGQGWKIIAEHPTRRANVIGFDAANTTKRNLPIVSAVTIVKDRRGGRILVQINEAVYNESSNISLLSEYQVRSHGGKVDSVPMKHGGTQSFTMEDITFGLTVQNCMVGMVHNMPTEQDLEEKTPLVITQGEEVWNPRHPSHTMDHSEEFAREVIDLIDEEEEQESQDIHIDNTSTVSTVPRLASAIIPAHLHRVVPKKVNFEKLSPYFLFRPNEIISKTLENTTQLAKATIHSPMRRHMRSRFQQLRKPRLNEIVATDTYFSSVKSIEGYHCSQLFFGCTSKTIDVYGMKTESEFVEAYQDFMRDRGIPHTLRRDNAQSERSEAVKKINRDLIIKDESTEPHSPWQNPAEVQGMSFLKAQTQVIMNRVGAPPNTWFLCQKYLCEVHNHCANRQLAWQSPEQVSGGDTPDISHILQFYFYEPVLYLDNSEKFPNSKEKPGYFVGYAKNTGDALTFKILTDARNTILHRSVVRSARDKRAPNRRVTFQDDDVNDDIEALQPLDPYTHPTEESGFDEIITIDDSDDEGEETDINPPGDSGTVATRTRSRLRSQANVVQALDMKQEGIPKKLEILHLLYPTMLFFILNQPVHYEKRIEESKDVDITDAYDHEHHEDYDHFKDMPSNLMEQMKYLQAMDQSNIDDEEDDDWNVKRVLGHRTIKRKGTNINQVKAEFADVNKSKAWIDMFALCMMDPLPILRYAKKKHILDAKPFKSLVNYCQGKPMNQMVRAFKARTHPGMPKFKFGVQVPMGVRQALELDRISGSNLWQEAMEKEIRQLDEYKVFETVKELEEVPTDYQKIPYHFVFDVKFDLRRKARLVADGNWTEPDREDIYSGVVAMNTVRVGFLVGEMNNLTACAADVGNAYLNSMTREKVYILAGPEFGPEREGKPLLVVQALYGLRTSAARFREHLATTLRTLGFKETKADADFWYRDKGSHYEYIATYVDDILAWSRNPMDLMDEVKRSYTLKGVGVPEYYLGGNVEQLGEHWNKYEVSTALSASTYIENMVPKFEKMFDMQLRTYKTPMAEQAHPELDDTPFLSDDDASRYRSIIGSLNWLINLGRFDVHYATMSLSRFNVAPRQGHLTAALRVLSYVKNYPKGKIIIDGSYPSHVDREYQDHSNWKEFYPDAKEDISFKCPTPKSKEIRITVYVDADHAHDQVTRRSVTGIIVFMNNTPVRWFCKKQNTVETSTYGSELVAARIATELIIELRYLLREMGVIVETPAMLLGDNLSVVLNTTVPSSVLKKKHCAISYHRVREAIAAGIMVFAHVPSTENVADILTKPLPALAFHNIVKKVLFRTP